MDAQNLVYLYSVPWPTQGLYFKKQVNSTSDLAGVKFRAYTAANARIAALAGIFPVQIAAAELCQALATGGANSFLSSGATGAESKVWESLTHVHDVQGWLPRTTVFVNKDAFGALDAATQAAFTDCGAKAAAAGSARAQELTAGYLKTLLDNGMSVSVP